jgi:PiT family inorganic phosphate transporter
LTQFPATFALLFAATMVFGFLDGFHSSANVVATVISSRAMAPRRILLMAGVAVFIGPFLFGLAVAQTIGRDLAAPADLTLPVVIAAVLAAILWKLLNSWLGIPASSSHSLFGGLIGAIIAGSGANALLRAGLTKIITALVVSPLVGLALGYLVMKVVLFLTRGASPQVNLAFKRAQMVTAIGLALSHGANDAQKAMGILTLGLVTTGLSSRFEVPWWVIVASAAAMALGTMSGARRIIRTLGGKFYKIRPVHGFAAQAASGIVIMTAAILGGPVSTTQVVSSSIVGVGSAERLSKVRWSVLYEIALAWLLTIPATALAAALLQPLVRWLLTWLD